MTLRWSRRLPQIEARRRKRTCFRRVRASASFQNLDSIRERINSFSFAR
jgi:hypothetical protein